MLIIGERLNGASKKVAVAIKNGDDGYLCSLAAAQTGAGADLLDICSGLRDGDLEALGHMISVIQKRLPGVRFSVDTPDPNVMLACLPLCDTPGMINSVTPDDGSAGIILPAAKDTGWMITALLLSKDGGDPVEGRLSAFKRLMDTAEKCGIAPERIYFDPMLRSIAVSPDSFAVFSETVRRVRAEYPEARIICGVSNISYGMPCRRALNRAFITAAAALGVNAAIADPLSPDIMSGIYAAEALTGGEDGVMRYIEACREGVIGES